MIDFYIWLLFYKFYNNFRGLKASLISSTNALLLCDGQYFFGGGGGKNDNFYTE